MAALWQAVTDEKEGRRKVGIGTREEEEEEVGEGGHGREQW